MLIFLKKFPKTILTFKQLLGYYIERDSLSKEEKHVPEFKKKLVAYYEGEDLEVISEFLKKYCWKTF